MLKGITQGAMPMHFTPARPDAVRAINQRWLLKFWIRHLDGGGTPSWQAIKPDDLAGMSDNLSMLDITDDWPPRFRIRYHGHMIGRAYGSADCRGRYLDEVVPAARRDETIALYAHSAASGVPVYTIHDITDGTGRLIHFERLLLPFARDGQTIDRILASFEFVCPDGDFKAEALMSDPGSKRTLRLKATIKMPATA